MSAQVNSAAGKDGALSDQIRELFRQNPIVWGMYYFPHYFKKESPGFHLRVLQYARNYFDVAVQAPRGSAKSVLLTFLDTAHDIAHKASEFTILIQNTFSKAAGSLENIKMEFRTNERLKRDYGVMMRRDAEGDAIFRLPDGWECRVLCKGSDQLGSIRGERYGAYRPRRIKIDDIEDDELVKNPERRQDLESEFNEVIKYAGEAGETKIIVMGTILHDDSLMAKLVAKDNYKHFKKLFYKARYELDGEIRSLWPEKWTVEDLNEMEKQDPVGFAKEMQGDPSSGSLETIRRADFRYWRIEGTDAVLLDEEGGVRGRWALRDCKAAIGCDLAWEEDQASDFSAIVPGFVTPANDLLVEEFIAKKGLRPDELEEILFSMTARLEMITGKRVCIGFEKAKLEKVMKWFLGEAQRRRNKWLWLKDISWGTKDKVERVLTRLANRYSQHAVYHKRGMGDLENQLIRLRSVAHDDIADALSMLPEMLAFAPSGPQVSKKVDNFDWWAKQSSAYRNSSQGRQKYIFGQKQKASAIRTVMAPPV